MVRVLGGKYYPNRSFMKVELGSNPSYTWKGILEAREVLMKGLQRRIGNGLSTKLWQDPWIARTRTRMALSSRGGGDENMLVAELIRLDGSGWDTTKVRSLFLPFDQSRILNMRVTGQGDMEDDWMWELEKSGVYFVKSAYKELMGDFVEEDGQYDRRNDMWLWRRIWSSRSLPRIKIFFLAVLGSDGVCAGLGSELRSAMGYERVREWVEDVIREIERDDVERFITGVWALWERRNRVVFEYEMPRVERVVRRVSDLLKEMVEVQQGEEKGGLGHYTKDAGVSLMQTRDRRPCQGSVRISVDAGVKEGKGMGIGVICRDDKGDVLWSWEERRQAEFEVRIAEAEAILQGLRIARRMNHQYICMEGDCMEVIEAL
ncbi:uncharacterized protein LOC141601649 [Silene latifolia]|uniref:uncharacterized protein LOC141601649 n=1 Tax=Silene latifolia TaxID=37657 RepID=UPI003D7867CD